MNVKNRNRKEAIDKLLDYLLVKLNKAEDKMAYRDSLLNSYSYETGISIRTLREYASILGSAGLVRIAPFYNPRISLVEVS